MIRRFTISCILFVLIGVTTLFGQNKTRIGIYAGPNLSSQTYDPQNDLKKSMLSYHFAGLIDIPINKQLYLQPVLSFQGKGVKTDSQIAYDGPNGNVLKITYLEVPVNVLWKVPAKRMGTIVTGGGPYVALGIAGEIVVGDSRTSRSNIFSSNEGSGYKRTDFGMNFQLGTELHSAIKLAFHHSLGIANIAPSDLLMNGNTSREVIKNQVTSFSIGYLF